MNRYLIDRICRWLIYAVVAAVVALIILFVGFLITKGWSTMSWQFLTTASEDGLGIRDQLFNSLYLLILTLILIHSEPLIMLGIELPSKIEKWPSAPPEQSLTRYL